MVIVSNSASSTYLRGLPMLFADRSAYAVNKSQLIESSALLKSVVAFLETATVPTKKFDRDLLVLLRNLNALNKYQTADLAVFNSLVMHPLVKFNVPHLVAARRYILGQQKTVSQAYAKSLAAVSLSSEGGAILVTALQEIMINESLALGVCLNEEELFIEDTGEEVVTQPVNENFHFSGSHLYYAGVSVSEKGLPQPEGARACLIDSVRLGTFLDDQLPLTYCSFGTSLGGSPTSSSAFVVGRLVQEIPVPNGTPETARIDTEFLLTPRVSGEGTKMLVLFSGDAQSSLVECKHEVIRSDLKILEAENSTFSVTNKFKKRWLADNLLEIICRADCSVILNSVGLPVVATATGSTNQMVQTGLITAGATINATTPPVPVNLTPSNLRLCKVKYTYGPAVPFNSTAQVPMNVISEENSFPVRFAALPRFTPWGSTNVANTFQPGCTCGGVLTCPTTDKINSSGVQIGGRVPIKLKFNSPQTMVYAEMFSTVLEQSTEL